MPKVPKIQVSPSAFLRRFPPKPEVASGAAVVVFPSGGWKEADAQGLEGYWVGNWLSDLGFGDGGRIAAQLAYPGDDGNSQDPDTVSRPDYWPDFVGLGYAKLGVQGGASMEPGASLQEPGDSPAAPGGSSVAQGRSLNAQGHCPGAQRPRRNAQGLHLERSAQLEDRAVASWPPLFVAHAQDDSVAPIAEVERLVASYRQLKEPVRFYAYPRGGHGLGMSPKRFSETPWPAEFALWLKEVGFAPHLQLEKETSE